MTTKNYLILFFILLTHSTMAQKQGGMLTDGGERERKIDQFLFSMNLNLECDTLLKDLTINYICDSLPFYVTEENARTKPDIYYSGLNKLINKGYDVLSISKKCRNEHDILIAKYILGILYQKKGTRGYINIKIGGKPLSISNNNFNKGFLSSTGNLLNDFSMEELEESYNLINDTTDVFMGLFTEAKATEMGREIFNKYRSPVFFYEQSVNYTKLLIKSKKEEKAGEAANIAKGAQLRKTIVVSIFALLFVFFGVFSFLSGKRTTKLLKEVKHQKLVIEAKNHEITDSINYAQRIQRSILPPLIEVSSALPNSFILFKPKDIVSGDFYWFFNSLEGGVGRAEDKNDSGKILIAAADCTGHGVPGAFMSTIGSEKLNEAVKDSSDVSAILNLVNRGMKKVLRQSEKADSTRDGMDIALCAFNKEMTKVEYSGANRPLWIVRKGIEDIEETKATKVAIGGYTEDEQVFTKHTIDLQKGDSVYIFSDGYADQFSPQDKKLMTRKFKEILLSIQDKSMEEQKQFLGTFIEDWRGNMEQTDDILVIGVRV